MFSIEFFLFCIFYIDATGPNTSNGSIDTPSIPVHNGKNILFQFDMKI
jgi:hypothetical protein